MVRTNRNVVGLANNVPPVSDEDARGVAEDAMIADHLVEDMIPMQLRKP